MSNVEKAVTLIIIVIMTAAGDYALKYASGKDNPFYSWQFFIGLFLYGAPAIGWLLLMKQYSLAQIGALYSSATIIILLAIGKFHFGEEINMRQMAGVTAAIASIWLSA